jgi:hypothetical protein
MRVKEKTVEFMIAFFNESFEHKDNIYGYMVSMEASGWRNNLACTLFGFKAIIALQVVSRRSNQCGNGQCTSVQSHHYNILPFTIPIKCSLFMGKYQGIAKCLKSKRKDS